MDLTHLPGLSQWLPYFGILIAAAVEGEIAYIGAVTLVADGRLNATGVLVSGAIGAAIGDQAFFYALRGRLPRFLSRYPSLQQRAAPLVDRVRRHTSLMVLLIRFTPGLRLAIVAACAWVEVPPRKFSALNLLSAFGWAYAVLAIVGWFGPAFFAQFGLGGWKGALIIGVALFGLFRALGVLQRRALERPHPVNSK